MSIAAGVTWRPIDLPPRTSGRYLVAMRHGQPKVRVASYLAAKRRWDNIAGGSTIAEQRISHWAPLPQPPKADDV